MNPQAEPVSPTEAANPPSNGKRPKRRSRPRSLDDTKRQVVCAMVSSGCGLRDAARYVNCSVRTIRREAERNPEFDQELRRSKVHAKLNPLRAMHHAIGTHWRAAAWFLERAFPQRFGKPNPGAFSAREVKRLLDEMLRIVNSEIDPLHISRVEKRVKATFEYHLRCASDQDRNSRALRDAMAFFEDKEHYGDPLVRFGLAPAEPPWRAKSAPGDSSCQSPRPKPRPSDTTAVQPHEAGTGLSGFVKDVYNVLEPRTASMDTPPPAAAADF